MRALVKDFRDRLESFLACRIPDLQLHANVLHAHQQGAELNTDGHLVVLGELIMAHSVHEA